MGIQDGTYAARPGQARVYENDNGSLVLCMEVQIEGGPVLKSFHTLAKADGTLMTRTIDNLKAWSGWDGTDPFWFTENDLTGFAVEVVIENQPGRTDPTKLYPSVKWVNPPGGGGAGMAESGDRRTIMAKYGAKLRANAGGVAVAARPPTVGVAPVVAVRPAGPGATVATRPAVPSPVPVKPAVRAAAVPVPGMQAPMVCDMNTCWALLCGRCASLTGAQREQEWFAAVAIIEGKDQADMTPEDWGRVEAFILAKYDGKAGMRPAVVPPAGPAGGVAGGGEEDNVPF